MLSTVSPKSADPAFRTTMLDAAARLLAEEGSNGLTLRRLANEVGTSTMAIYTHFGSMDEVRRAIRREGFGRLAIHLAGVGTTDDPVSDLGMLGLAYYLNAVTNPNLYRAMFLEQTGGGADAEIGIETFEQLVAGVDRCIRAGRFDKADPVELALQLWSAAHGVVALHLARILSADDALGTLGSTALNLFKAFGDDPGAATKSVARAGRRAAAAAPSAVPGAAEIRPRRDEGRSVGTPGAS
jgi:AcrR family transcriptional regulator